MLRSEHHFTGPFRYPMTQSLAYVLGVLEGDGCVFKSTAYMIRLEAKDQDFVQTFYNHLGIIDPDYSPCLYQPKAKDGRNTWISAVGSKKLYVTVHAIDVYEEMPQTPHDCIAMFLRGFFDSDGTAYAKIPKAIYAYNSTLKRLVLMHSLLGILGIQSRIHHKYSTKPPQQPHYILAIYKRLNISRFAECVGFTIRRKQQRVEQLVDSYCKMYYPIDVYWNAIGLAQNGMNAAEIGRVLNIHGSQVSRWVAKWKIPLSIKSHN